MLTVNRRAVTSFAPRVQYALKLKEEGTNMFKLELYTDAISEYERSIGMFQWIQPIDEDWKQIAMNDDKMTLEEFLYMFITSFKCSSLLTGLELDSCRLK
jgi:hypothetical protein